MNPRPTLLATCLLVLTPAALGQLIEAPLSQRIDAAQIIVEGVVLESTPFLNPEGTLILTSHRVRVSKVFKHEGARAAELRVIDLVTPGGRLGERWHVVQPALALGPGMAGLFFVDARQQYAGLPVALVPHAGRQGFVRYDAATGTARDAFSEYDDVRRALYGPIQARVGQPYRELGFYDPGPVAPRGAGAGHSISGFSPANVRAGVQDLLTISGSGFGTQSGSATVLFDEADNGIGGYAAADPVHVVSWSDTQIQVLVPNRLNGTAAGTGLIAVRDAAGVDAFSAETLTVDYGLPEILRTDPDELFRVRLEDQNQRGGYTFVYSTGTDNAGVDFTSIPAAVARFEEGLDAWRCATGWNADIDGTTAVTTPGDDGINIVSFDNAASPLPGGVLGQTSNFYVSCGGDTWRLAGADMRFKRDGTSGVNWYYGADEGALAASEDDFLSTLIHELGHAVQHSHVNDPSDAMYYRRTTGIAARGLSAENVAGAADILGFSSGFADCGTTGMDAFDCALAPAARFVGSPLGACGTGLTVDFHDLTLNGPTSWAWDFGDSGTSTQRNPSHDYTAQGLYSVSLSVTNDNGGDTLDRSNYIVVTDGPVDAACEPTFAGHNNCCSIGILNVTLNSLDLSTDTNTEGDPLLEDFSCSAFTVLDAGATYPISVTTGPFNNENVRVYIDWDGDGVLAVGELAFSSGGAMVHPGSIDVPAGALADTALRMRVLSDFPSINDPCDNIDNGQVEDYSVVVRGPSISPGAVPETSLTLDKGASAGDVGLTWGASCGGGATDYTVHEGTLGSWYSHAGSVCSTGGSTAVADVTPAAGDRYFLVVPISANDEGSYGTATGGGERPASASPCRGTQDLTSCP